MATAPHTVILVRIDSLAVAMAAAFWFTRAQSLATVLYTNQVRIPSLNRYPLPERIWPPLAQPQDHYHGWVPGTDCLLVHATPIALQVH